MTKKEVFVCDICHTDYYSEIRAIECEKSHKKIEKIKAMRINPYEKYPDQVCVQFSDEHECWYYNFSSNKNVEE